MLDEKVRSYIPNLQVQTAKPRLYVRPASLFLITLCRQGLNYLGPHFWAGGLLREVSFDGTSWDVVGNVPIDY
jgi:hypothetical protein